MSIKVKIPNLLDESVESFDSFVSQFERYLRVSKINNDDLKVDILLLSVGEKLAKFYDEVTWEPLNKADIDEGITNYQRVITFFRDKLSGNKNVLSERIRLYNTKQKEDQGINAFVSEIRLTAKWCAFPVDFGKEALRDAFCQGLYSN